MRRWRNLIGLLTKIPTNMRPISLGYLCREFFTTVAAVAGVRFSRGPLARANAANGCAGTPRSHSPDGRDDEMSDQDEPIPHAATMAAIGGVGKSMTQSPIAAELQFAMDRHVLTYTRFSNPRPSGNSIA